MNTLVVDCRSGQAVPLGGTVLYPGDGSDDWTLLEVRDCLWRAWCLVLFHRAPGPYREPGPARRPPPPRWVQCPVRWFHPAATERGRYRVVLVPT